jgi:hypothetical protein
MSKWISRPLLCYLYKALRSLKRLPVHRAYKEMCGDGMEMFRRYGKVFVAEVGLKGVDACLAGLVTAIYRPLW